MRRQRAARFTALILKTLCVASAALCIAQGVYYIVSKSEMERSSRALMRIEMDRACGGLAARLRLVEEALRPAAKALGGSGSDAASADGLLKKAAKTPLVAMAGIARAPGEDGEGKIEGYRRMPGGGVRSLTGDALSDYSTEPWYRDCPDKEARWSEPYRDASTGKLVVAYVVPFPALRPSGEWQDKAGVVFAVVPLESLREIANSFRFGATGYSFLLSARGVFLYHPIDDVVVGGRTIFEILSAGRNPHAERIIEATKKALAGQESVLDVTNRETGNRFLSAQRPLGKTGWVLSAVFSADEMRYGASFFRHQQIWLTVFLVLFLGCLAALLLSANVVSAGRLWAISSSFAALCLAGSFYIWHLAYAAPLIEEKGKTVFTDAISLNHFLEAIVRDARAVGKKPPLLIPTGIHLQSLAFVGSNDLRATGYVWQRYTDGLHDGINRGFVLAEAQSITTREAYRRKADGVETVGWYFEATIRQRFDYSRYPFDRPAIRLWLRHIDFLDYIILVPDLGAYQFTTPATLPGMQQGVALPGYAFLGTFFEYEQRFRRTTFGVAGRTRPERAPELYYDIVVRRNFTTPFVSKLFPLFIMFAILFVVQLMFSQDEEKKRAFGLSAFAVMGVVITFFFSTLLSHTTLRQDLGADRIIFIENFHFIAYLFLLLVTIKTLLFIGNKPIRLVQYRGGLILKLLYWPLFAAFVFIVSCVHFY